MACAIPAGAHSARRGWYWPYKSYDLRVVRPAGVSGGGGEERGGRDDALLPPPAGDEGALGIKGLKRFPRPNADGEDGEIGTAMSATFF